MAEFQAGEVVVPVVPSAGDFIKRLKQQLLPGAYDVGQAVGRDIQRGIKDALGGIYAPLQEQTRRQQQQAPRDGEQVGGAFARGFKARVEAALRSLPKVEVDADSTAAQVKIAELRTRMEALAGKTVGIDVDAAAATAEVAAIQRELAALDGKGVSADVRVDIASALAELAAVDAGLSRVDGKVASARVDVDVSGALAALGALSAALAGVAAIPVAAGLAAGLGALSGPLVAAGAGFAGLAAVAVPSVKRINEALKEQEKAASSSAGATKTAQQATTSAAQAAAEAASRSAALEQAERRITDAKVAAKAAEEGLTEARRAAKQAAEDLARSVANAALSEESAALSVEEARERLAKLQTDAQKPDSKVGDLELRRAELAVREAEQRHKDAKDRSKDLQAEQAKADKAGVEGSKQVVAAKEKIAKANQAVKDSEAQLKLLRLQQAAAKEKPKPPPVPQPVGVEAKKFDELSPAAQKAAKQIKAFQGAYESWQKKLEPAVLPLVTGGLKIMQGLFKPLTPLVTGSAKAVAGLEKSAQKALGNPFWKDFFKQLSANAPTAITGLGKAAGSVATGVGGIIKAFLPFVPKVVGGIQKAAAAFGAWGKNLGKSEGFKSFISYVQTNVPKVVQIIKNIGAVIGKLFQGTPTAGAGMLDALVSFTDWLAGLSVGQLQTVALGIAGIWAGFKGWKVVESAVDGVKKGIATVSSVVSGAKRVWSGLSKAATTSARLVKMAASGIGWAVKGLASGAGKAGSAVWSGIQTAASKAAGVARSAGTAIAGAARTAGAAAARGGAAVWSGIQSAAGRAASAARTAGTAIATAARTAATAAVGLGKVALEYGRIAIQAGVARARMLLTAAAQGVVKAATVAWAAAQRVLNLALSANPIGLIITAIGLLVAGLIYAWNNSETFRNVVTAAWEGIKTAVSAAWTNVIQPALQALWAFVQNTLAPVFSWLWNNIIVPAWNGISAAVTTAWNTVIQPALKALWTFVKTVLAPAVSWLWENVIKPAFSKIGEWIKTAWATVIQPALKALWTFITETLAPKISWLYENVVKPAFSKAGEAIKSAWDNVIKPTFDFLKKAITEDIPNGFDKGVGLIKTAWEKVQDVAKKPVQFIVDTVYNNGILKVWNAVAKTLKLPELEPLKFASGGIYPGYTPGKDVGLAAVSGGEAIMRPEWTRAVGENYVHGANAAARKGGVGGVARFLGVAGDPGGFAGAFADGGIVGDIKAALAGGIKLGAETLLNPLLSKASAAMGNTPWAQMLVGIPKALIGGFTAMLGEREEKYGGGPAGPGAKKAIAFARAQIGKPYQWGATGPNTFDCSGLTMRSLQAAGLTDVPRVTYDQIHYGKGVSSPAAGDLGFPHSGHVWLYSSASKIVEAPYTGAHVREVAARSAQVIRRPTYDNGGYLMPGTSLVHNGTGRPEPVLTDKQWQMVFQGGNARGGDGSLVTVGEMHVTPEQSPYAIAEELRFIMGQGLRSRG